MNNTAKLASGPCRIALGVEYDGAGYCGWQKQLSPVQQTVQQVLERSLSRIADSTINLICAGRTDRGVHASSQVVHFDSPLDRGNKAWVTGTNSLLPASIRVTWSQVVSADFHARFSATARRYFYVIRNSPVASAIMAGKVTHARKRLDIDAMTLATSYLPGEKNFSAFRAARCQSKTPFRCVHWARIRQSGEFIVFDIQANAFLQHMVRNIVGSLLSIGRGEQMPQWIEQLLAAEDRTRAAPTAAPDGLYLVAVEYPEKFGLPATAVGPTFLDCNSVV